AQPKDPSPQSLVPAPDPAPRPHPRFDIPAPDPVTKEVPPTTLDSSIASRSHAAATGQPDPTGQTHQTQLGKVTTGVVQPPLDRAKAQANAANRPLTPRD